MALELESLLFRVETTQLDDARIKLAKLGDAVNALNKPMQDMARSSAKTNEVIAKSELAAEKARVAQEKLASGTESSSEAVKKQTSILERQQMILEFMTQGYSKGQSSQLAYAKAAGAITTEIEQLGKVLQTQRTLMGTDPFDKSIGAIQALKNEYTVLKEVQRLYNAELGLSKVQMEDLAKEKIRLIERYKLEGKTLSDIKEGIIDLNQQYIKNASAENAIISAMKSRQDAVKAQTSAEMYLAKETERVNRLLEDNGNITSSTNNRLIKYEQALRASGVSSEVAAAKLAKYKEQLIQTQKITSDRQMDYLSRALGPQITDIFVGLATGQSPMMVLLQQGGQLRDQFALAGVEGANMGKALTTAFTNMYASTKDVSIAVGTMLVQAFAKVGKVATDAVASLSLDMGLLRLATDSLAKRFPALAVEIAAVGTSLVTAFSATAIAAFVVATVGAYQRLEAITSLNKDLVFTGAALGLTRDAAIGLADGMSTLGMTSNKAMQILGLMSKQGGFTAESFQAIALAAKDMERATGQSAEDTIKKLSEFNKDPVKALRELQIQTGAVSEEVLKNTEELIRNKQANEAGATAVNEAARVYKQLAGEIIAVEPPYKQLWEVVKGIAVDFANAAAELGIFVFKLETLPEKINKAKSRLKENNSSFWYNVPVIGTILEDADTGARAMLKVAEAEQRANDAQAAARKKASDQAAAQAAIDKIIADARKALDDNKVKEVSRAEFIAKKEAEVTRIAKDSGGVVPSADLIAVRQAAALEWDKKNESRLNKLKNDAKKQDEYFRSLADKANDYYEGLKGKDETLTKSEVERNQVLNNTNEKYRNLTEQQKKELQVLWDKNIALEKELEIRKKDLAAGVERNKLITEQQKEVKAIEDRVKEQKIQVGLIEYENSLVGISQTDREYLVALKKEELEYEKKIAAIKEKGMLEGPEQDAIAALTQEFELRKKSLDIQTYQKQFNEVRDVFSGAIADAFFEGGKKGADSLKNYLKTTFRKYVIDVLINPIIGSIIGGFGVQGAASGTAGSFIGNMGSSVLTNAIGGISGVASAFGTAFSNAALSTVQGWVGMSGTAAQMGTSLANAGYYAGSAAGTTASGVGATIGAYAPYVLAAVTAYEVLKGRGGETRSGATYVQDSNGLAMYQQGPSGGEIAGDTSRALFNSTKNSIESVLKQVGSSAALTGFTAGLESSSKGKGFAFAGGFVGGQSFGASSGREGYRTGQWSYKSMTAEEAMSAYISELNKATLQALMAATDVPNLIKNKLQGIDFRTISDQDVQKLVSAVNETIYAVNSFITEINWLGIKGLSSIDFSNASKLIEAFGDISKAGESLSFFYDNFYSKEEKMLNLNTKLSAAFEGLGLSIPKTTQEFRDLMQGALGSGNYSLAASLAKLQAPLVDLIGTADDATKAFLDLTNSIQQEIDRLLGANTQDSSIQGSAMRNEFDILSAMARNGDASALARLPEFSQAIEKNMQDFATSASDVIFARAMLAQSLTDTMSALSGSSVAPSSIAGAGSSTILSNSVVQGGSSLSTSSTSQSDLISSLIVEIQGLRAEVRADVSANSKTAKILERANQDGETISVTVA